jgi:hypothetical protein
MMLRLDPPIPVEVEGRKGMAHVLIDYGPDYDLIWLVAYDESREFWCVGNPLVRSVKNITMGRET